MSCTNLKKAFTVLHSQWKFATIGHKIYKKHTHTLKQWMFSPETRCDHTILIWTRVNIFKIPVVHRTWWQWLITSTSILLNQSWWNIPSHETLKMRWYAGLSLSFESLVALIFTPVTNLIPCEWIESTIGKFTCSIKGPSYILSFGRCYRLRPFLTALICIGLLIISKL